MVSALRGLFVIPKFITFIIHDITGPIRGIQSAFHIAMEAGIRPIRQPLHQAVFHGIPVHIVDMPRIVCFVADGVFPEPPLPDTPLPLGHPNL